MRLPEKFRLKNTTLWAVLAATYTPLLPLLFFVERQDFFKMMDSVLISAAVGIAVGVSRGVWKALRLPAHELTAADIGLVSVFLICIGSSILFGLRWYWRAAVKIELIHVLDGDLAAFGTYVLTSSIVLLMIALFSRDGQVVVGTTGKVAAFVGGAVLFCAMLIGLGFS